MNWYDWVLIAPIVLGVILGFRVGLVKNVLYIVLVAVTMIVGGYLSQIIVDAIGLELESDGLVTVIGYGLLLIGGFCRSFKGLWIYFTIRAYSRLFTITRF